MTGDATSPVRTRTRRERALYFFPHTPLHDCPRMQPARDAHGDAFAVPAGLHSPDYPSPLRVARSVRRSRGRCSAAVVALLLLSAQSSYLLFHSVAEIFSIAVACAVFMISWSSRGYLEAQPFVVLGIGYLFVAIIDCSTRCRSRAWVCCRTGWTMPPGSG